MYSYLLTSLEGIFGQASSQRQCRKYMKNISAANLRPIDLIIFLRSISLKTFLGITWLNNFHLLYYSCSLE